MQLTKPKSFRRHPERLRQTPRRAAEHTRRTRRAVYAA